MIWIEWSSFDSTSMCTSTMFPIVAMMAQGFEVEGIICEARCMCSGDNVVYVG